MRDKKLISIVSLLFLVIFCTGASQDLPPSNDTPSPQELAARNALGTLLAGKIVFDSNRGNGFGIHIVDPSTGEVTTFADTERQEMYPDVSPDGKWIVYASLETMHKRSPSDIYIKGVNGTAERKLVEDGTFPTFSFDGSKVYFERKRKLVMQVDVKTGAISEIFPKGHPIWSQFQIVKPQVSPSEEYVAFISEHPRKWSSWYASLKTENFGPVGKGCEPTWFPDSSRIAWVSGRKALERSSIATIDLASKTFSKLQDADAPRGHEYFPTISDDTRFLLYAAARPKEHNPTRANYQIFVKNLESGETTRITFDPYTNRWPKLLR